MHEIVKIIMNNLLRYGFNVCLYFKIHVLEAYVFIDSCDIFISLMKTSMFLHDNMQCQ